MSEPAGIFGAFEPLHIPFAPAPPPPKYDFGLDTLGAGWKGGSAGTDYGLHQSAYGTDIARSIFAEAKKKGIDEPLWTGQPEYERRVQAAGGNTDVLNPFEKSIYDEAHGFWRRIAEERAKDSTFLKDYPMVVDEDSLQEEARRRRAVDEEAANEIYAQSTIGGKTAWWLGNFGTAVKDPLSYLPLGGAAKAETTVGAGILKGFARGATTNAALTAAEEPFVQLDANARGQDRGLKDVAIDIGLSAAFGGLLEGAHGGLAAKFATPDEKAAAHVINRDAEIRSDSPFHPTPAGDAEHGARLAATIAALDANKPVPQFKTRLQSSTSLASGEAQFRAHVDVAEGKTKNPLSSANYRFQFVDKTWLLYYKREIGANGLTDAQILAKKSDGKIAEKLFNALTADNKAMLHAAGLPDSATNLYMAHFLGPKSLRVLRAAADTPVESLLPAEFITANPKVLKGKTAGEVIAWADRKMGGTGVVHEAPDVPVLREDQFASEADYRDALAQETAAPASGPDFALPDRGGYETVYRGNMASEGGGNYFSTDREWARNFTQSGLDEQISEHQIPKSTIYEADTLPLATKENQIDAAIAKAKEGGFKAIRVDEGAGEPNSVFVFDKTALDIPVQQQSLDLSRSGSAEIGNTTVDFTSRGDVAEISMVKTPEGLRGQGSARNAMEQFVAAADRGGVDLYLTPEPVGAKGASKTALTQFYKSLGFEPVTNRTRDFRVKGTMVRKARPAEGDLGPTPMTGTASPNEIIPDAVVRETEAEGPHFTDPNGPDAVAQVDSVMHDLKAGLIDIYSARNAKGRHIGNFRTEAEASKAAGKGGSVEHHPNAIELVDVPQMIAESRVIGQNVDGDLIYFHPDRGPFTIRPGDQSPRPNFGGSFDPVNLTNAERDKFSDLLAKFVENKHANRAGTLADLTAEDLGDTTGFRIAEEGKEITVADALENIAKDEAAIKALKDCL